MFLLFSVNFLFGSTNIPGGTIDGDVWTKENAPYYINGNLTIVNLTIEPGVYVNFSDNYKFEVSGKLIAEGFYSDSIYFRLAEGYSGGWDGISFVSGSDSSYLRYCRIESGVNQGISVENASPYIANCRIRNNSGNGLKLSNTSLTLSNCRIENNDIYGIYLNNVRLTINNSIIVHNTQDGFYSINGNDSLAITNCVVADNFGSGVFSLSGSVIIKNSIFDNGSTDIDAGSADVTYSNILDGNQGTGNINVDPQFINSIDYDISNTSPCIDAGDPSTAYADKFFPPSQGTTRNDMGVYGGPGAGKCYPPIATQNDIFNFGNVSVDSSQKAVIKIMNYRDTEITISSLELVSDIFSTDVTSFTVAAYDTFNLETTFTPNNTGVFNDSILLHSQTHGDFTVNLSGTGVVPDIDIPLVEINFSALSLGTSDSSEINIINRGHDTLRISQIYTTNSAFYTNKQWLNIDPRSANSLQITFKPDSAKSYIDSLVLISNDPDEGRLAIALKGSSNGPVIALDKDALNFDNISLIPDTSLSLTITNLGNQLLTIQNFDIEQTDTVFSVINSDLPHDINPGGNYNIFVRYKALASGRDNALLNIISSDPIRNKKTVSLTGPGQIPKMVLSQQTMPFGKLELSEFKTDSIFIYNNGDAALMIDSLSIRGKQNSAFTFVNTDTTGLSVNAADSLIVEVRFQPLTPDSNRAKLFVFSQDQHNPVDSVGLSGYGIAPYIHLSNTSIDFGSIPVSSSNTDTFLIYNSGESNLLIDSLVISGENNASFSFIQTDTVDITIRPDSSYKVNLRFSPSIQDTNKARLYVFSNAYNSQKDSLILTGRGLAPRIELSNSTINYDTVAIDHIYMDPIPDTVYVKNTGTSSLRLFPDQFIFKGDTTDFIINLSETSTVIAPGDSSIIQLSLQTFGVGSKEAILKIVSNDPFTDTVSITLHAFAKDKPANISYDSASSTEVFFDNKDATLSFNIETYSTIDEALLHFRMGGENTWHQNTLSKQNETHIWSATLETEWITSRGLEYYVTVEHGYTMSSWSKDTPQTITVTVTGLTAFQTTRKNFYQEISVPLKTEGLTLSALLEEKLGDYDDTKYRIFDCLDGMNNMELNDGSDILVPGKAYWLITKESVTLDINDTTYSVPTNAAYEINLRKGWNLISSPFPFPVNWSDVDTLHALRFYKDNGDWAFATVLDPYSGYAVYTENAFTLSVPPIETELTDNLKKQNNNTAEWNFRISAKCSNLQDSYNYAGVRNGATNETDRFDYPEPPPMGKFISVYLLQTNNNSRLSTDYRTAGEKGYIFEFELSSNLSGEKSIEIIPQNIPEHYSWIVVSPETKIIYADNLIKTSDRHTKYKLIVGTNEFIEERSADYAVVPMAFHLSQNYPNPFNPNTKIEYQLPQRSTVTIDIYNILGQRIKTLVDNEPKDAGYYQLNWDGTNINGANVSTGIYFLFLRTEHFNHGIKMILQR